jgi:hypothetical protein
VIGDLLQFQFFYDGLMLLLLGGAFSRLPPPQCLHPLFISSSRMIESVSQSVSQSVSRVGRLIIHFQERFKM